MSILSLKLDFLENSIEALNRFGKACTDCTKSKSELLISGAHYEC